MLIVGKLDITGLLDNCWAKVFVAVDNQKVVRVLSKGEGTSLVGKQVRLSLTFAKGGLDAVVKDVASSSSLLRLRPGRRGPSGLDMHSSIVVRLSVALSGSQVKKHLSSRSQ
jgi:hypothetical protein